MIKQLQKAGYKSPSHLYWMQESYRRLPVFIPLFFPNAVLIWAEKKIHRIRWKLETLTPADVVLAAQLWSPVPPFGTGHGYWAPSIPGLLVTVAR